VEVEKESGDGGGRGKPCEKLDGNVEGVRRGDGSKSSSVSRRFALREVRKAGGWGKESVSRCRFVGFFLERNLRGWSMK